MPSVGRPQQAGPPVALYDRALRSGLKRIKRLDTSGREDENRETTKRGLGRKKWRGSRNVTADSCGQSRRESLTASMSVIARPASAALAPSFITAVVGSRAKCGSKASTRSTAGSPTAGSRSASISVPIAAAVFSGKAIVARRLAASLSAASPTRISRHRPRQAGRSRCTRGWDFRRIRRTSGKRALKGVAKRGDADAPSTRQPDLKQ